MQLLRPPFLPLSESEVAAHLLYRELPLVGELRFGTGSVLQRLNHPGGNLSLKALGSRIVHACDFEHDDAAFEAFVAQIPRGIHFVNP